MSRPVIVSGVRPAQQDKHKPLPPTSLAANWPLLSSDPAVRYEMALAYQEQRDAIAKHKEAR
jgi:hypothetical protein